MGETAGIRKRPRPNHSLSSRIDSSKRLSAALCLAFQAVLFVNQDGRDLPVTTRTVNMLAIGCLLRIKTLNLGSQFTLR